MKGCFAAGFLIVCLMISFGCSTPSGTVAIGDLQKNAAKYLGKNVIVVGTADIKTELSPQMIKMYTKFDYVWISRPESSYLPDQGRQIRVTGTFQKKRFNIIGEVYFIEAAKIEVE
jgi:hypothetical protein